MIWSRKTILVLLCGLMITTAASADSTQKAVQPGSARSPVVLLPATLAEPATDPLLQTVEKKPAKELAEKPCFWRFLEGLAIGAATYNTRKQDDGRPQTPMSITP